MIEFKSTIKGFREEYYFLSNMYEVQCPHAGLIFKSSEHLYQWLKIPENATWWKDAIFNAEHGKVAKVLAANPKCPRKDLKGTEHTWDTFRLEIMDTALRSKFSNQEMREKLLATEDTLLVEYNTWHDTFWGVCGGSGWNRLGQMLMDLRQEFHILS